MYTESTVRDIPFSFSQKSYPLNPSARVAFTLAETQEVTLRVYDSYGRLVHTLCDNTSMEAGNHEMHLYGDLVPSGGCYVRLITPSGVRQRTLVCVAGEGY